MEGMTTLEPALIKHSLLVCVLLLLTCCTGADSEDYTRTMWVSTTGEDSPQCIHDTPTSGPVPHPRHLNESCRTLNYALSHIGNDTLIVIGCGIHVLEPVDSTTVLNVVNIVVMGNCTNDPPMVQCSNGSGANLEFYNAERVYIKSLNFQGCGKQLQHSDSLTDSSTLYFQNCREILLRFIKINITGPYGRGISLIRNDATITEEDIILDHLRINHSGFHGSGVHFEVLTNGTRDVPFASAQYRLIMRNLIISNFAYNPIVHPLSYNITTSFTGIKVTVMGDGEGGEIEFQNIVIHVGRSTKSNGISLLLQDSVYSHYIVFEDIAVMEQCVSHNYLSNTTQGAANNSTSDSRIKIELGGNSTKNRLKMDNVYIIIKCGLAPGSAFRVAPHSAFSIEVTDHSEENIVWLQKVYLLGSNSSEAHSRGLQVIVTGWARRNKVEIINAVSLYNRAHWGAGGYIEYSGHAIENQVVIRSSYLSENHALRGGGIAVVCGDFATQNEYIAHSIKISKNFAELGSGIYYILQNSSSNNTIQNIGILLFNNLAHSGGGMCIHIQDSSVANLLESHDSYFLSNTLLSSESHDMMGGGVHVEFSTVRATFRTDNIVSFTQCVFILNTAELGVGGGISLLYKHSHYQGDSGDGVIVHSVKLYDNGAKRGSACHFWSTDRKRLFSGVKITNSNFTITSGNISLSSQVLQKGVDIYKTTLTTKFYTDDHSFRLMIAGLANQSLPTVHDLEQVSQSMIRSARLLKTNTDLIFTRSVQITADNIYMNCGAFAQGIFAQDSEIVLLANSWSVIQLCVATHGGAIALYGESYIRVSKNSTLDFHFNYAFQRGGAIYVDINSSPGVVPVLDCFLQHDQEWEENQGSLVFYSNSAKDEGQSVYVSNIQSCHPNGLNNITTNLTEENLINLLGFVGQVNFMFRYQKDSFSIQLTSKQYRLKAVQREIVAGPYHIESTSAIVNLNKPVTMRFIPGKQTILHIHTYDMLGSIINSVFRVNIDKMDDSLPVELDISSKYTDDFTVILHGIPQQHGMAKHFFPQNTSTLKTPPQLVLQSLEYRDLRVEMNVELQCCPPGYIYQYGSGDMGTCHCGMHTLVGITACNESHTEVIGAVLERDHWAGYLPSNDQHSCDGQKIFSGLCPPGYCQTQPITLSVNNSQQELQEVVCAHRSNRKGILCGECFEGNSIAVNFNGIRPVCISCEEGLSKVGFLLWILSEWVPMLAFMFVLMLFNIDLVSGRFNSFLLFTQLLAFSTIRGDAELGPVHNAFVRIYRFLYGMWNLDFFGMLLPPYCLAPHAHLTLLQTLLLHYSIGLFPLTVAITLTVLERSAEKWICCHRVDQCLRRMRRWKAKYSDGMSYDRALPAFVILGFTRFLVSSSYILVNQTITGEDGERKVVVWWQGSVHYGSIQHIAYLIPAIVILLVFVLLPSFVLLTLPIGPQLFGRLIIAVPPLRKLQRIQTFCSNVYTDRWVYHFVNVFQGCYKERFRSISSLYLFHRVIHLLLAAFIPKPEDSLRIQIILTVALLLLIATLQPYNSYKLNTLDAAILGNLALILILSLYITDLNTPIGTRQFFASLQMILIYLPLLYPGILLGKKVYLKCRHLRCCQKQEEPREDNAEPLLEAPAERLGNFVLITELRAGVPTSENDDTVTETETET